MMHARMAIDHPQCPWGANGLIKMRLAAAPLEMPEMLDRVCLVARELEGQLRRMQYWYPHLPCNAPLTMALLLEGSGDAAQTRRRKF